MRLDLIQERESKCQYLSGKDSGLPEETSQLFAVPRKFISGFDEMIESVHL